MYDIPAKLAQGFQGCLVEVHLLVGFTDHELADNVEIIGLRTEVSTLSQAT